MQPFETIYVDTPTVACNGGGGALGHPKVYLNLGPNKQVECPYCSRLYIRDPHSVVHPPHAEQPPAEA
jgi:uncharacterized Zn-finger protein